MLFRSARPSVVYANPPLRVALQPLDFDDKALLQTSEADDIRVRASTEHKVGFSRFRRATTACAQRMSFRRPANTARQKTTSRTMPLLDYPGISAAGARLERLCTFFASPAAAWSAVPTARRAGAFTLRSVRIPGSRAEGRYSRERKYRGRAETSG